MYEELVKLLRDYGRDCENGWTPGAIADAIERLQCFNALWQEAAIIAHEREPKWIPVTERLPNKSGRYLTVLEENGIQHMYVAIFQNKFNLPAGKMSHWKVTHWMPLPSAPEPPKEET